MILVGYGVLGVLAIAGVARVWRTHPTTRLLSFWAIVVVLMGYIPVNYQRRFVLGLGPVLAILAVLGWRQAMQNRRVRKLRRRMVSRVIGSVALIMLLWGQNIIFYSAYAMSHLGRGPMPYAVFQPHALAEAAAYLGSYGEKAVVLTCEEIGNLLAGEIPGRVVLGHSGATLNVAQRREEVADFFAGRLSLEAQAALLKGHHVSHILTSGITPLQCGDVYEPGPIWHLAFEQGGIKVYAQEP